MVQETEHGTIRERLLALVETSVVFAVVMLLIKVRMHLPSLAYWQGRVLGRPFIGAAVCLYVFPLLVIKLTRLESSQQLLSRSDALRSGLIGLISMTVLFPAGSAFGLLQVLKWSWLNWKGAVVLTLTYGIALPLVALVLKRRPDVPQRALRGRGLAVFAVVLLAAMFLSALTRQVCPLVGKILYSFLFVGMAEELLARGYFQTRLSRSFGRPYRLLGIRFGWGLILASCLFGLMHYLSPSNPFHLPWAVWVTTSSLVFGLIREKGGSFIASGVAHGLMLLPKVVFAG